MDVTEIVDAIKKLPEMDVEEVMRSIGEYLVKEKLTHLADVILCRDESYDEVCKERDEFSERLDRILDIANE